MGALKKRKGGAIKPNKKKASRSSRKNPKSSRLAKVSSAVYNIADRYVPVSEVRSAFSRSTPTTMRRRRRMNPLNAKATRKAATRVRSSLNFLKRLEKSLPHVTSKGHVTKGRSRRR